MYTSAVLQLIRERTSSRPISLAELCEITRMTPRSVKRAIERLRSSGNKIDAIRDPRSGATGYYLRQPGDPPSTAALAYERQMLTMARIVKVLRTPKERRQFAGQLALELSGGAE